MLPNYNYSINVNIDGGKTKLVNFLMIDTQLLCGNTGADYFFKNENKIFRPRTKSSLRRIYFKSIESKLERMASQNYSYVIVAGHYPVWAVAEHGPTKCLVSKLRPLLHKYKIDAYFSGINLKHKSFI